MSKATLKQLAYRIFQLARREVWLGGRMKYNSGNIGPPWPDSVLGPQGWGQGLTWTLSPEVELGGHKLRLCISWGTDFAAPHCRIFVDGEVKHPGGEFKANRFFGDAWIRRIAKQERAEGGKTGPVDTRDLLLTEAFGKVHGKAPREPEPVYCDLCQDAVEEIDRDFLLPPPSET